MLGCTIIGVLDNGPVLPNVAPFCQRVVKGFVILFAFALDRMNTRNRDFI